MNEKKWVVDTPGYPNLTPHISVSGVINKTEKPSEVEYKFEINMTESYDELGQPAIGSTVDVELVVQKDRPNTEFKVLEWLDNFFDEMVNLSYMYKDEKYIFNYKTRLNDKILYLDMKGVSEDGQKESNVVTLELDNNFSTDIIVDDKLNAALADYDFTETCTCGSNFTGHTENWIENDVTNCIKIDYNCANDGEAFYSDIIPHTYISKYGVDYCKYCDISKCVIENGPHSEEVEIRATESDETHEIVTRCTRCGETLSVVKVPHTYGDAIIVNDKDKFICSGCNHEKLQSRIVNTILIKRGLAKDIDNVILKPGELAVTLDTGALYVGDSQGESRLLNVPLESAGVATQRYVNDEIAKLDIDTVARLNTDNEFINDSNDFGVSLLTTDMPDLPEGTDNSKQVTNVAYVEEVKQSIIDSSIQKEGDVVLSNAKLDFTTGKLLTDMNSDTLSDVDKGRVVVNKSYVDAIDTKLNDLNIVNAKNENSLRQKGAFAGDRLYQIDSEGNETEGQSYNSGKDSTALGRGTITKANGSLAIGEYNESNGSWMFPEDTDYILMIGNGTGEGINQRSNAHTVDRVGNAWFAGDITFGADKTRVATQAYVDEKASTAEGKIPLNITDLNDDFGLITKTVDNLTNYYKKSETYTQQEVKDLIGAITTITFEVVGEKLADVTKAEENKIYLVPLHTGDSQNIYAEWIWINNAWEQIGSTEVNLDGYYNSTQIDNKFSALATVATSGSYADLISKPDLKTVATTGSYNDLIDKPTIPDGVEIVNSINSTDTTKALSAAQGKVLADAITNITDSMEYCTDADIIAIVNGTYNNNSSGGAGGEHL